MSQDYNNLDDQSHEKLNINLHNGEGETVKVSNSLEENLNQNLNVNIGCSNRDHYHPEIRIVNIQKDLKNNDGSCGFNLTRSKWDPYPWVSAVDKNSPAYNADLKVGDCILEVNGDDILGLRISEIANLVKINSDNLQLLIWSTGRDPKCDENSLCCGPMPLSLERLSATMQTILACLECPVCMDIIPAPVIQCQNGHILCLKCRFKSDKCPVCRQHYSCVRSLISEQIYSTILNAFKLNGVDNDDNDDNDNNDYNDDMHMNNIRSTGRKLREKLFGAKYKKKDKNQNEIRQQQLLFTKTTNFKSTTRATTTKNNKSASTIGINDTSSYDLNLNNGRMNKLVRENQNYYGSNDFNINSDSNTEILTPTNKFLAKISLNRAHSLENLSSTNSNETHHVEQDGNIKSNGKLKYQVQMKEPSIESNYLKSLNCKEIKQFSQSTNDLSSFSMNYNGNPYSKDNGNNNENNNITSIIAIPRCPSLNPLTETKFSSSTSQLISLQPPASAFTTTLNTPFVLKSTLSSSSLSPLSVSVLDRQLWYGSLKGLNKNYNSSFTIGYTDNINSNINTNSCGIIMNTKSKSNVSLSVNNLHSTTTANNTNIGIGTLMLQKRPSPSASSLFSLISQTPSTKSSLLQLPGTVSEKVGFKKSEEMLGAKSLLNIPSKSVENVDFTYSDSNSDAVVNQCLTLTVPKINEIKNYHCIDTDLNNVENVNNNDNDNNQKNDYDCNSISKKIEKIVKLTNDIERFLCPYDCCDDKFNASSLNEHVKNYHLIPIISFGTNFAEIALPLQEPMNSAIIELNLNENIFWIQIGVNKNGSIFATAFLQGTEDESLAFMLEGQLQNRVDDKLLEKQLITRSMIHSMMRITMNKSSWNNIKTENSIATKNYQKFLELNEVSVIPTQKTMISLEDKSIKEIKSNARTTTKPIISYNNIATGNFINDREDINNVVVVVTDELNTLNYINKNNNSNNNGSNSNDGNLKNLKNCITIKKDKIKKNNNDNYDKIDFIEYKNNNVDNVDNVDNIIENDDDDKKQIENVFFDYNSIKTTFNINNNNHKKIELLLRICVKYK